MAAAPASSTNLATSTAFMVLSSMPILILTVTGFFTAFTSLLIKLAIFSGCLSISLPAPVLITFHAGQPQFTSIMSNFSCSSCAALTTSSSLWPNNCTATGLSISSVSTILQATLFPRTKEVLLTNSVYVIAAPYFLASALNATSVTPDIGESTALPFSFGNFIEDKKKRAY